VGWFLFFVMAAAGVGLFVFLKKKRPKETRENQKRNGKRLTNKQCIGDARLADFDEIAERGFLSELGSGLFLGLALEDAEKEFKPVVYSGDRHALTIAPNRSGKLTTVIAQTLLTYRGSVVVTDIKGELAAITARRRREMGHEVVILNPFGVLQKDLEARGFARSARFNPLATLDPKDPLYSTDVKEIAHALVMASGGDSHWTDSARALIEARILFLVESCPMEQRTLRNVREFLGLRDAAFLEEVTRMRKEGGFAVQNKIAKFMGTTNEILSVCSTADTQTQFLDDPAILDSMEVSDFDFAAMKDKPTTVYLVLPLRAVEAQARWLRLVLSSALGRIMTDEPGERVLFLMDEFAQLGHLGVIERSMAAAAGLGVQLWPFVQDIHQLKDLYGTRWQSFLANAGFVQFFTPSDIETAKYISEWIGNHAVRLTSDSKSFGTNGNSSSTSSYTSVPFLSPQEILGMNHYLQMIFANGLQYPIQVGRLGYWDEKHIFSKGDSVPYDENPYHKKKGGGLPEGLTTS
jgi:type IV secretion system protein VirD4